MLHSKHNNTFVANGLFVGRQSDLPKFRIIFKEPNEILVIANVKLSTVNNKETYLKLLMSPWSFLFNFYMWVVRSLKSLKRYGASRTGNSLLYSRKD